MQRSSLETLAAELLHQQSLHQVASDVVVRDMGNCCVAQANSWTNIEGLQCKWLSSTYFVRSTSALLPKRGAFLSCPPLFSRTCRARPLFGHTQLLLDGYSYSRRRYPSRCRPCSLQELVRRLDCSCNVTAAFDSKSPHVNKQLFVHESVSPISSRLSQSRPCFIS
jgi:hypothetical protein